MRQGDGRNFLLVSDKTYDIISVNVLDPYLPGSSSLYTVDFWREAREHLRPGGVYTQLFWGEDVDMLVAGLERVFPTVLYFPAYGGTSYNVVAFREPAPQELTADLSRLSSEARRQLEAIEGGEVEQVLPRLLQQAWVLGEDMRKLAAGYAGPLHTDWHPVLEYRWAHGVTGVSPLDSPLVQY